MATIFEKHFNFTARFYAKGNYNGAGDHTLISFQLSDSNGLLTGISNQEDTAVEFVVDGSITLPDRVRVIALQSFEPDNAIKFETNIFRGRTENHVTNAGATTIDGILKNPSLKAQAGTQTTVSFHIDKTLVALGETYYLQIIVADSTNGKYTTFISDELTVIEPAPAAIVPVLNSQALNNYNKTSLGDCIATVPERLRSKVEFSVTTYNAAVTAKYGTGNFDSYFQDIIVRIFDDNTGELLQSSLPGDITFITAGALRTYTYNFRLKHDAADSWEGKTLNIQWELKMFYPKTITLLTEDHTDHLYIDQYADALAMTESDNLNNLLTIADQSGHPISSLCDVTTIIVTATGTTGNNLIALIDSFIYSQIKIEEEEAYVSPQGLLQLATDKLFDVDVAFVAGVATFKIDVSKLNNNVQYRIFAISLLP